MDMPKSGGTPSASDSGAYSDLNRLNSLKTGDRDSTGNLKKVAQEFESLFVSQMLKSMRSANEVLAKDNPMNTSEMRQYQEMYDQQLAVTMSRQGGGIGLQDVLMRQLSKIKGSETAPASTTGNLTALAGKNTDLKRSSLLTPASDTTADSSSSDTDGAVIKQTGLALQIAQRPLWASRSVAADHRLAAATAAINGGVHNDVAKLNARRLSLPTTLTDRLLAGIVPATGATLSQAASEAGASSAITGTAQATVRSGATFAGNGDWTQNPSLKAPGARCKFWVGPWPDTLGARQQNLRQSGCVRRDHVAAGQGRCSTYRRRPNGIGGTGCAGNWLGQIDHASAGRQQQP